MRLHHRQSLSRTESAALAPLRWEHLEPGFLLKLEKSPTPSATATTVAEETAPTFDFAEALVAACMAVLFTALYISVVFHLGGPGLTLALFATPLALGITFRAVRQAKSSPSLFSRRNLHQPLPREPAALFACADLTTIERVYADLLCRLVADTAPHTATDRRALVREANALLAHHCSLEHQRNHLQRSDTTEASLLATQIELRQRLDAADEPAVRHSLEQSLTLCTDRLATHQAMRTLPARIDAHQEAIYQALHLALETLTYRTASARTAVPPHVGALHEIALRLAAQTRAAEEAIHELRTR